MTRSTAINPIRQPADASRIHDMRPEELRGRSIGVFVCAGFGLMWAGPALSLLEAGVAAPLFAVSIVVFAVLVVGGLRVRGAAVGLSPAPEPAEDRRAGRRFGLVVGVESVAIGVAVAMLNVTGHPFLIPAVVCAAVGLHFVPLAAMFQVRLYLGTAAALCLVAVATVIVVPTTGAPAWLWQALPGFGAAVSLWVTGGLLIRESLAPVRPGRASAPAAR